MAESTLKRGVLDTSVVVGLSDIDPDDLPDEMSISAVTLAELAAGPRATSDPVVQARRQHRLQWAEATFDPLPFDASAARAYGLVYASVVAAGRKPRGRRAVDLFIAATALALRVPVYTCNPDDFVGIDGLEVIPVGTSPSSVG
ncbi:MAG: type II toxin-antitoxin system VapC family toxin [Solirubrobacteraceae bacterium]